MADKPTAQMKKRTNIFVLFVMMFMAAAVIIRLFKLSVVDNKFYQDKANEYHFGPITISANRGSIYDCNGVILAQSATVYKVYMDPDLFRSEISAKKEILEAQAQESTSNASAAVSVKTAETAFVPAAAAVDAQQ